MARFSGDSIERVRDAADIVELISAYTDLKRSGQRFTGLCPFHDERTPSFSVSPPEGVYHCFGCGVGGDAFTFMEEKEGLAFADAVEALADRFGVEVEREEEDPRLEQARKRRARLAELLDRTAAFYVASLWESHEARKAREYLAGRGLGEEVLREFGVGYAPSAWDTVLMQGRKAGYEVEEMAAAGLVKKGQKGGFYDHFRARIMFPIRDARGRMQGFGGRALRSQDKAKYVNSPDGELYRKGKTLYAIERARPAIAKAGRAVVVEGYTDVLAAHQAGIGETIAVMGTAITPDQVQLLAAHAEEVVLALDADRAGREAMLRAQRVAAGKRVRLRVAAMPEGEDPADMLAGEQPGSVAAERFAGLLDAALDLPAFHVGTLLDEADLASPTGRDRALDELLPVLASMPDSITRDELVREVGGRLSADPALVSRRLAQAGRGGGRTAAGARGVAAGSSSGSGGGGQAPREPRSLSAHERREEALLAMCIASPADGREYLERLGPEHLSSPLVVRAQDWLALHLEDPLGGLSRDDEDLADLVTKLVAQSGREPAGREAMELNFLQLDQTAVERRIAEAEAKGGDPPVELQHQRAELAERIAHELRTTSARTP